MAIKRTGHTAMARVDNDTTTITISHNAGSGNCLIVLAGNEGTTGVITGMTWGGVALTRLTDITYAGSGATQGDEIWGLQDASPGTQNLVITKPLLINNRTVCAISSYGLTSTSATFPDDSAVDQDVNPSASSLAVSVTTTLDNCILVGKGFFVGSASDDITAGTDTTEVSGYRIVGKTDLALESSPLSVGTAGAHALQINCGSINQNLMLSVVAIAPNPLTAGVGSPMII